MSDFKEIKMNNTVKIVGGIVAFVLVAAIAIWVFKTPVFPELESSKATDAATSAEYLELKKQVKELKEQLAKKPGGFVPPTAAPAPATNPALPEQPAEPDLKSVTPTPSDALASMAKNMQDAAAAALDKIKAAQQQPAEKKEKAGDAKQTEEDLEQLIEDLNDKIRSKTILVNTTRRYTNLHRDDGPEAYNARMGGLISDQADLKKLESRLATTLKQQREAMETIRKCK